MEINKRSLTIKVEGEEFKVSYPSVKDLKGYNKSLKGAEEDVSIIESTQKFLETLGLPFKVSDDMEMSSMKDLVEIMSGQKKL